MIASEELSGEIFTQPHAREKQTEVKIKESKFALHATQTDFLGAILISTKIMPQIKNPGVMVEELRRLETKWATKEKVKNLLNRFRVIKYPVLDSTKGFVSVVAGVSRVVPFNNAFDLVLGEETDMTGKNGILPTVQKFIAAQSDFKRAANLEDKEFSINLIHDSQVIKVPFKFFRAKDEEYYGVSVFNTAVRQIAIVVLHPGSPIDRDQVQRFLVHLFQKDLFPEREQTAEKKE